MGGNQGWVGQVCGQRLGVLRPDPYPGWAKPSLSRPPAGALGTGSKPISVSEQEGPLPPWLSEFLLIATTLDLLSQASCL